MHLALPSQKTRKTMAEQLRPALVAAAAVAVGVLLIPVGYPVHVTNGAILPHVARPGDRGEVRWDQNWTHLCPVTVTREFVGADGFKNTAAPFDLAPPDAKGVSTYRGPIVLPNLPAGDAYYHSIIRPHCWVDRLIWQREYRTPEIRVTMLPAIVSGPR